ncbi:hypothetical protein GALL_348880 [mine drainage metagenome]|uniref:Uncharacterized protein n=1 Tax=mine drainage metagenome TaxID=410659 RepID=A0A1J5R554_9ZZZZ
MALVQAHHVGDAATQPRAQREQFGAAVERQRQHFGVRRDRGLPRAVGQRLGGEDEAAADRVVDALEQQLAGVVPRLQLHAVGVSGQRFAALQQQVGRGVERDVVFAEQLQPPSQRGEPRVDGVDVDAFGLLAEQAEQHRLVAAVAAAGRRQRAVQPALKLRGARQQLLLAQRQHEQTRRAHRTDGVRARRADADAEQIEDRYGHGRGFLVWLGQAASPQAAVSSAAKASTVSGCVSHAHISRQPPPAMNS